MLVPAASPAFPRSPLWMSFTELSMAEIASLTLPRPRTSKTDRRPPPSLRGTFLGDGSVDAPPADSSLPDLLSSSSRSSNVLVNAERVSGRCPPEPPTFVPSADSLPSSPKSRLRRPPTAFAPLFGAKARCCCRRCLSLVS